MSEVHDSARPVQGRGRLGSSGCVRRGDQCERQTDERDFRDAGALRDKKIRVHAIVHGIDWRRSKRVKMTRAAPHEITLRVHVLPSGAF